MRATTQLSTLTVQQNALGTRYQSEVNTTPSQSRLSIVQAGAAAGDDKQTRLERYGLLGLALGFVLALLVAAAVDRLFQRRRSSRSTPHTEESGVPDDQAMVDLGREQLRMPPPPSPVLPRR